ncbi:uncharacterized protein LOC142788209 [Rhipicephalus microplus]|uniref:uncharacterized protein LOC142788209 n=1 Tax=Rhipicephalus microplus TaxID=6941 RepID=UPI003F6B7686
MPFFRALMVKQVMTGFEKQKRQYNLGFMVCAVLLEAVHIVAMQCVVVVAVRIRRRWKTSKSSTSAKLHVLRLRGRCVVVHWGRRYLPQHLHQKQTTFYQYRITGAWENLWNKSQLSSGNETTKPKQDVNCGVKNTGCTTCRLGWTGL